MNETGNPVADVRLGVRLTAREKKMLDELAQWRYPGRQRMLSVVLAEIIRAAHEREQPQRQKS